MNKLIFYTLAVFLLWGCSKNKPPTGLYTGEFNLDGHITKVENIEIEESSKERLLINGSTFQKDKRKITGTFEDIDLYDPKAPVAIEGTWEKRRGVYYIEGDFATKIRVRTGPGVWESFDVEGAFVIKSTF